DVHAGCQAPFHERTRNLVGFFFVGDCSQDETIARHFEKNIQIFSANILAAQYFGVTMLTQAVYIVTDHSLPQRVLCAASCVTSLIPFCPVPEKLLLTCNADGTFTKCAV